MKYPMIYRLSTCFDPDYPIYIPFISHPQLGRKKMGPQGCLSCSGSRVQHALVLLAHGVWRDLRCGRPFRPFRPRTLAQPGKMVFNDDQIRIYGGFHSHGGTPIAGCFRKSYEDGWWTGVPPFMETPISWYIRLQAMHCVSCSNGVPGQSLDESYWADTRVKSGWNPLDI